MFKIITESKGPSKNWNVAFGFGGSTDNVRSAPSIEFWKCLPIVSSFGSHDSIKIGARFGLP